MQGVDVLVDVVYYNEEVVKDHYNKKGPYNVLIYAQKIKEMSIGVIFDKNPSYLHTYNGTDSMLEPNIDSVDEDEKVFDNVENRGVVQTQEGEVEEEAVSRNVLIHTEKIQKRTTKNIEDVV